MMLEDGVTWWKVVTATDMSVFVCGLEMTFADTLQLHMHLENVRGEHGRH